MFIKCKSVPNKCFKLSSSSNQLVHKIQNSKIISVLNLSLLMSGISHLKYFFFSNIHDISFRCHKNFIHDLFPTDLLARKEIFKNVQAKIYIQTTENMWCKKVQV